MAAAVLCALAWPDRAAAQIPDVTRAPGELPEGDVRLASALGGSGFVTEQLRFERVRAAMGAKRAGLAAALRDLGLELPPAGIYVRVFKAEREVEVWVRGREADRYVRLRRYPICQVSGALGPKRQEGDRQIPEGFYAIESFNPQSDFHLSLRVNYPNASDRILGRRPSLGGDIYLHGGCSTVGCVPVTDDHMRELYWLSVEARGSGLRKIPIHIFPTRMDSIGMAWLAPFGATRSDLAPFWAQLKGGYEFFERHRRVPGVVTEADGSYTIVDAGSPDGFARALRPARKAAGLLGTPADDFIEDEGGSPITAPAGPLPARAVPVPELTGRHAAEVRAALLLEARAPSERLLGAPTDEGGLVESSAPSTEPESPLAEVRPRLLGAPLEPEEPESDVVVGPVPSVEAPIELGLDPAQRTTTEAGDWLTEDDVGDPRPPLLGEPVILGKELVGGALPPGASPITLPGFEVREAEAIPGRMPYRPPRLRLIRLAL